MKKIFNMLAAAVLLSSLAACQSEDFDNGGKYPEPSGKETPKLSVDMDERTRAVANETGDFSVRFFQHASNMKNHVANTVISPASVMMSLSMLANGDDDAARNDVLKMLGYEPSAENLNLLNTYNSILAAHLPKADGQTMCRFANSVWHDPGTELADLFVKTLSESYLSEDIAKSPSGEKGMNAINKWVKNYTNGMIPNFLKEPLGLDVALINATYFKGVWADKFSEKLTTRETFTNIDNRKSETEFMHNGHRYNYARTDNMQAVALPYGNGSFEMVAFLPPENIDFKSFVSNLSYTEIDDIIANFNRDKKIELSFPKFESEYNDNIFSILSDLGLNNNKFGKVMKSGSPFLLTMAFHAVNIKVDEKGSEAAASTLVGGETSQGPAEDPEIIELNFNRPFVYLIRECSTGAILFMGSVTTL